MAAGTLKKQLGLTLRVLAVFSLLALTSACSARRSEQLAGQGATYLNLGRVEEAKSAFERSLAADPQNVNAKLGLARCYWAVNDAQQAIVTYKEAIALAPNQSTAYMEAARVCLAADRRDEAMEIAAELEAVMAEEGGILRAYVLRKIGRPREAIEVMEKLREAHANSQAVRLNLATAYLEAGDAARAEQELKQSLAELNADSLPTRMKLVEVHQAQGKLEELETELRTLAKERPTDLTLQLALARSLLATKKFEEAEAIARPILEQIPESPWANFVVGSCLLEKGQLAEAAGCLQIASAALPDDPAVSAVFARAKERVSRSSPDSERSDKPDVATAPGIETWREMWKSASLRKLLVNRNAFEDDTDPELAETLALAAVFTQNVALSKDLADKLPPDSHVARYITALTERDPKSVIEILKGWNETSESRKILRANAEGFALGLIGARAQAFRVLSECISQAPDNGVAFFNIAMMYRSAGMPKFAIGALQQLASRHTENLEARLMLYEIMRESAMEDEARKQAEATFALFPEEPSAQLNLARAYRDTGDVDLAQEVLKRGSREGAGPAELTLAYSDLLLYAGKIDEADAVLARVQDNSRYQSEVAIISGFIAAARADWNRVREIGRAAAGPAYPLPLRLLYTAALLEAGQLDEAAEPLRGAGGEPLAGPSTNVLLRTLGVETQGFKPEVQTLSDALKTDTRLASTFAHAMACREARFNPKAFELFRSLDQELPGQPLLVELTLESLARSRFLPDRLETARGYTTKYPAMAAAWLGLAEIQRSNGEVEGEYESLQKAWEVEPSSDEALRFLARHYDRKGDLASMLEVYRNIAMLLPDDPFVCNNLAYCILQTGGDPGEALTLAKKAAERLGQNPYAIHTLGLAQVRHGETEEGGKNLALALEMNPGDPTLLLDYGKLLLNEKRTNEGRNYIQLAVLYADQLGLEFPRRAEAVQVLTESAQ